MWHVRAMKAAAGIPLTVGPLFLCCFVQWPQHSASSFFAPVQSLQVEIALGSYAEGRPPGSYVLWSFHWACLCAWLLHVVSVCRRAPAAVVQAGGEFADVVTPDVASPGVKLRIADRAQRRTTGFVLTPAVRALCYVLLCEL